MNGSKKDFFISYNKHDKDWAEWIAFQLESNDYTVVIQAWDFAPGNNFVLEMQRAMEWCERTIIVLSPHFLASNYTQPEWAQAFAADPTGEKRLIVPVRVHDCELKGCFSPLIYIDFLEDRPLDPKEAKLHLIDKLLSGVKRGRRKPTAEPPLPAAIAGVGSSEQRAEALAHTLPEVSAPKFEFHGAERKEISDFLNHQWISKGPCVAILQGIPGSGKSQLASSIQCECMAVINPIPVKPDSDDPSQDLLMDLASALEVRGIVDLEAEIDNADGGDLFAALLRVLRRERIVIIIDEFQGLLDESEAVPPSGWQHLIEALNNSVSVEGRLLLITNRSVKRRPWSEKCHFAVVKGFDEGEAAAFLVQALKEQDVLAKVPTDRIVELGKRLGGNPRALKTLAQSLHYYSLDDLLSTMPSLEGIGDVNVEADLLDDFERGLIERTIPNLGDEVATFMRCLSVNRRSVNMMLYQEVANVFPEWKALRKHLIDRFLLEAPLSGDRMHPLAREICVARLRSTNSEWKRAHSLCADYHLRTFKTTRAPVARNVASSFSELRHHLFESGRISELYHASARMTKFVIAQIPKQTLTKIPATVESLEEHIALISALPEDRRNPGLEYHLALCLKERNVGGDHRQALLHVRRAARPDSYYAVWLLLIDLEYSINGVDAMKAALGEALRHLGNGGNASAVYHAAARLLDKDGKVDEAINLLEKAAKIPGIAGVASLVSHCSRLLRRAGDNERAFRLLKTIANKPAVQEIGLVFGHWATALIQQEQFEEAVELLDQAIQTSGMTKLHSLYLLKADCLVKMGSNSLAIDVLRQGIADKRVFDAKMMYCRAAEQLVAGDRIEEAVKLLERGLISGAVLDPLPLYHSLASILETSGQPDDGVRLLEAGLSNRRLRGESSLYLACANLWFHQQKLEEAVSVLDRGLREQGLKEKNQLIQKKADLVARLGRKDEAIQVLKDALMNAAAPAHLEFLYRDCAELLAESGRAQEAIKLLVTGTDSPAVANKSVLFQLGAKLLEKEGQPDDAVSLLMKGLKSPGITGTVLIYQTCAKILVKSGKRDEAVNLLRSAIRGPKIGNLGSLYQACAEILIAIRQNEQAIVLLEEGLKEYPKDQGVRNLHRKITS